jgi:hypothetical protein
MKSVIFYRVYVITPVHLCFFAFLFLSLRFLVRFSCIHFLWFRSVLYRRTC